MAMRPEKAERRIVVRAQALLFMADSKARAASRGAVRSVARAASGAASSLAGTEAQLGGRVAHGEEVRRGGVARAARGRSSER